MPAVVYEPPEPKDSHWKALKKVKSLMSYKSKRGAGNAADASELTLSDSRRRQSRKDDVIRRKIENDLNKKRKGLTKSTRQRKGAPGTVLSLKPSEPIVCKPASTVFEASQLMTAKRENCILVVNDFGDLAGIFTAKDLAFRAVAAGLNANSTTIEQIMTPNPQCANANSPASEALTLMVEKGFRHLPVLDNDNALVGVLDITKCYAQQMIKLERMHASSKKLYEALEGVQTEMGATEQPLQVLQYVLDVKAKMSGPTLDTVLNAGTVPVYASLKTTVYEATVLMKQHKTTAVLVRDNEDKVNGIFTSKDVVLRVIAAGLDPKICSIIRVMTPQPDVATHDTSIQKALRQMFEGHYLNLPVVSNDHEIIGIVDVLKLTYATLNQINQISESDNKSTSHNTDSETKVEGPAWNKFWGSLEDESDSVHSDSMSGSVPEVTSAELQSFNVELKPSDSISHADSPKKAKSTLTGTEESFIFKFRSPAIDGRVHRVSLKAAEGVDKLRELIDEKLHEKDFESLRVTKTAEGDKYAISYLDDEGDVVSITSHHDLIDCVKINQLLQNDKADLYLHNPHEPAPVGDIRRVRKNDHQRSSDLIPGVPNEILIPGTIMVLATSVIVGFAFSRR